MSQEDYPTPTGRPFAKFAFAGSDAQLLDLLAEGAELGDAMTASRTYAGLHSVAVDRGLIGAAA